MVLVTGGTGFLGAYIIRELVQQGYKVRAIRRKESNTPFFISPTVFEQIEWFTADILDVVSLTEAMQGADTVIHSAAKVSYNPDDKKEMYQINIDGTTNMVNVALELGTRRFVYISSVAAVGRTLNGEHIDEEKEWDEKQVSSHYSMSKHKAEMEVWRAIGEGLNAVILNPSTILGYGNWHESSCAIFKSVWEEFPYYTSGINGFVAVEDVATATIRLMQSDIQAERFLISADNWPYRQVFDTIADGFQKKHPSRPVTPFLAAVAWRYEKLKTVFTGKRSLLSKESARIAQTKTFYNNSKLLAALPGFSFTPLAAAIHSACAHYMQHLFETNA
ncbi:MAG: NAD-dependent epimerase/dehydratase family protein [Williamsia sp.]|nr:NAD-dependent epimerase/dehydratase family protein [Williamsia sp.]